MPYFEFILNSADGLKLHGKGWEPNSEATTVVCLVHGLGEHCGRYDHVAKAFNRAGHAFLAFDLRGHGRSEGKRGHAPSYTALMNDIALLLKETTSRYPNRPCFLYGHSLGGNLVIHYVLRNRPKLAGTIATAPLFHPASRPPTWRMAILQTMYGLWPNLTLSSGLEDMALSRDINVVRIYRNDPLVHDRISVRLAIDMLRMGKWNMDHAAELPCPLLLMHGDADQITSVKATREFTEQANTECTLKIWNSFFHELHNELEKEHVLSYVLQWMDNLIADG
jgi:alpha-beta hydrolase superfamily lysophospholipase